MEIWWKIERFGAERPLVAHCPSQDDQAAVPLFFVERDRKTAVAFAQKALVVPAGAAHLVMLQTPRDLCQPRTALLRR